MTRWSTKSAVSDLNLQKQNNPKAAFTLRVKQTLTDWCRGMKTVSCKTMNDMNAEPLYSDWPHAPVVQPLYDNSLTINDFWRLWKETSTQGTTLHHHRPHHSHCHETTRVSVGWWEIKNVIQNWIFWVLLLVQRTKPRNSHEVADPACHRCFLTRHIWTHLHLLPVSFYHSKIKTYSQNEDRCSWKTPESANFTLVEL